MSSKILKLYFSKKKLELTNRELLLFLLSFDHLLFMLDTSYILYHSMYNVHCTLLYLTHIDTLSNDAGKKIIERKKLSTKICTQSIGFR